VTALEPGEAWTPRRRSARPPRTPRGEYAARWITVLLCVGILAALIALG
jgi:hypothetical protein